MEDSMERARSSNEGEEECIYQYTPILWVRAAVSPGGRR
jgi:hypothetical protein